MKGPDIKDGVDGQKRSRVYSTQNDSLWDIQFNGLNINNVHIKIKPPTGRRSSLPHMTGGRWIAGRQTHSREASEQQASQ